VKPITDPKKWQKLVNIWQGGFCMDAVEYTSETWDEPNAAELRIKFLEKHIEQEKCIDCGLANEVKRIEEQIANELGSIAVKVFESGGDITKFPGAARLRAEKLMKFRSVLSPEGAAAFDKWVDIVNQRAPLEEMVSNTVPFRIPGIPGDPNNKTTFINGRDLVVELYLTALATFRKASAATELGEAERQRASLNWGLVNQARIFEVPVSLFANFYHLADRLTTKNCGWDYDGVVIRDDDHAAKYMKTIKDTCGSMWPEKFPFDVLYLAIDPPLEMSEIQRMAYNINSLEETGSAWLCAVIITSTGTVFTLANIVHGKHGEHASILPFTDRKGDEWVRPATLMPWVVTWIVEWINDHQVTIEERTKSFGYRNRYKKSAKRMKLQHIPAPYYTITMHEDILQEKQRQVLSAPRRHWELRYRHDVRGSTNCRIMRGPLPLDPKLEKQLRRDKRRKIFTDQWPDSETAKELAKRGVAPKKRDEWMSVLLFWRKDHIKGPRNAPFIPAIRRSARRKKDVA